MPDSDREPASVKTAPSGQDRGWAGAAVCLVAAGLAALLVVSVPALQEAAGHAVHGEGAQLRAQLRSLGAVGVGVVVAVMVVHAAVFYPSELITATAGYVYGFAGAVPIVLGGWLVSALVTYGMGMHAGRPVLRALAGADRLERGELAVRRGGAGVLLAARLIPVVPYSLVGYVAGVARVRLWTFAWTTVVGSLPLSLVVIVLGTRLEHFSLEDPLVWLAAVPVLVAALAARPLAKRMRL